jgi:predicted O-linked N-acetylglucosamine transferase (SPINDLY family)
LFEGVLQEEPHNFAALNGRGFIALQQNRLAQSAADFQQSLAVNPSQPFAHKMLGIVQGAMGQLDASLQSFAAALALDAKDPEVYFNRATFRFQAGQVQEALSDLDAAIRLRGSYLEARSNRANLLIQLNDFARAEKDLDYLVGKVSNNPDLWVALGLAKHKVGKAREAMQCNERALKLAPNHPDALLNSSSSTYDQGEYPAALSWAERAITATPYRAEAHYARAQALMAMSRFDEALQGYSKAIELNPNYAEAWMGRGLACTSLRDWDNAIRDYEQALVLTPNSYETLNNLGGIYVKRGEYAHALKYFRLAVQQDPDMYLGVVNEARALAALKQFDEAHRSYVAAAAIDTHSRWLQGEHLFALASACNWRDYETQWSDLLPRIHAGKTVCKPFSIMATPADLATRQQCSEIFVRDKYLRDAVPQDLAWNRASADKITVAYLSSDFYNHATSYLIAEMFELHDRTRFNIIGVCYGPSPADEMRDRVSKSFDQFIEAAAWSDQEIAGRLRHIGVDIAVDLKGHTKNTRLGVFAARAASIQMHYLGYPGTIGAEFIDYLVADSTLIPEEHTAFYDEKVVYLPDTYQVNDRLRKISEKTDTRSDHGLPEDGFVFCCFNNNWKISPDVFAVWMRLLKQVEKSVFWFLEDNEDASRNLVREAVARGIPADRLIFAKRAPLADHLARHRHADLFLDTYYCNAHTTASDALWAGLPVIAKLGDTFASRVSASLLKAVGLPELVAESTEAYEALAVDLATNPDKLAKVRQKLADNRLSSPLFDTPRFTRNLEKAYEAVWSRYQAGLPPDHIHV